MALQAREQRRGVGAGGGCKAAAVAAVAAGTCKLCTLVDATKPLLGLEPHQRRG